MNRWYSYPGAVHDADKVARWCPFVWEWRDQGSIRRTSCIKEAGHAGCHESDWKYIPTEQRIEALEERVKALEEKK